MLLRVHGRFVQDPDWPGEYVLDTSTARKRHGIAPVVGGWMDQCARKGFAAVEPDNLDSWTRRGVDGALTRADALAEARLLAAHAHGDGLAIAQKNTVQLGCAGRRAGFDFAIAEECSYYHEYGGYVRVYGRHVIEIDVVPRGSGRYVYRHC